MPWSCSKCGSTQLDHKCGPTEAPPLPPTPDRPIDTPADPATGRELRNEVDLLPVLQIVEQIQPLLDGFVIDAERAKRPNVVIQGLLSAGFDGTPAQFADSVALILAELDKRKI